MFSIFRDITSPAITDSHIAPELMPVREIQRAQVAFGPFGPGADPPRNRGELPDVDFSRLVRIPRASLLGHIAEELGLIGRRYELAPEEWRVSRPASLEVGAPGESKVLPFNRAA